MMRFLLQIFLSVFFVTFGVSSFGVSQSVVSSSPFVKSELIAMSAVDYSNNSDDAIRPSILLGSVERSRDRRRTFCADKFCYGQNLSLALVCVITIEKFYDTLLSSSFCQDYQNFDCYKKGISSCNNLLRKNIVLLI